MNVFSVDIIGEFAHFAKNDANDLVFVSFNFIHRPVILGMLGASIGLRGYGQSETESPEYYLELNSLTVAIEPSYHIPLLKGTTVFNNASGLASSSSSQGITWQKKEQILIGTPEFHYTIYIFRANYNGSNVVFERLREALKSGETVFPLYFGKNEFFAYHTNYREWLSAPFTDVENHTIHSLVEADCVEFQKASFDSFSIFDDQSHDQYTVYEHLPYDFDETGLYKKKLYLFTERPVVVKRNEHFHHLTSNDCQKETRNVFGISSH